MATTASYILKFDDLPTVEHLVEELETVMSLFDEAYVNVINLSPLVLELRDAA